MRREGSPEGRSFFLAICEQHPRHSIYLGDCVASQEPPGSTHSPLKEQIRAAPFFMHGRGTDEQAQKKAGRLNVLPSDDSIGVWMLLVI